MKRRKRKQPQVAVPTASMGDIAFLLTIFFMVCSNMVKDTVVVDPAMAIDVKALEQGNVYVAIDKDNRIYLNSEPVPDAEAIEWGVNALLVGKDSAKEKLVMFKCDKSVRKEVFEPVLDAIARGGGIIAAVGEQGAGSNP